jgi:hypothetical protein
MRVAMVVDVWDTSSVRAHMVCCSFCVEYVVLYHTVTYSSLRPVVTISSLFFSQLARSCVFACSHVGRRHYYRTLPLALQRSAVLLHSLPSFIRAVGVKFPSHHDVGLSVDLLTPRIIYLRASSIHTPLTLRRTQLCMRTTA